MQEVGSSSLRSIAPPPSSDSDDLVEMWVAAPPPPLHLQVAPPPPSDMPGTSSDDADTRLGVPPHQRGKLI
jgi:hypothetical protein